MSPGPCIEQTIGGTAVEAERAARRRRNGVEQRHVRDSAEVDDGTAGRRVGHDGLVEGGRKRGSLSTGGHVAPAEVRHRGDAGSMGDDVRVADLRGGRETADRFMTYGLAVTAHRGDVARAETRSLDGGQGRVGEEMADRDVEAGDAGEGGASAGGDFQKLPPES